MAKIYAEFDTVEKSLSVTIDGKKVDNVAEIYMMRGYSDESKFGCSLYTRSEDKDSGIETMTRLTAAESEEGKELRYQATESPEHPGFLVVPAKSKAQLDIADFFRRA